MSDFMEQTLSYELQEIKEWQSNDDNSINILVNSNAPLPIIRSISYRKGFIIDENGNCLGRRIQATKDEKGRLINKPYHPRKTMHFDVAKVVVNKLAEVKAGWYGSYKWLTNPDWRKPPEQFSPKGTDYYLREFEKIYQKAVIEHIGFDALEELQDASERLPEVTAPDLWFINNDGSLEFIEAKLDNKETIDAQIAGLALLRTILGAEVKVIRVQKTKKILAHNFTEKFEYFCKSINN